MADENKIKIVIPQAGLSDGTASVRALDTKLGNQVIDALGGTKSIERASHVEPGSGLSDAAVEWLHNHYRHPSIDKHDPLWTYGPFEPCLVNGDPDAEDVCVKQNKWFADLLPVGGPVLGPFDDRTAALAAEEQWIYENHIPDTVPQPNAQNASGNYIQQLMSIGPGFYDFPPMFSEELLRAQEARRKLMSAMSLFPLPPTARIDVPLTDEEGQYTGEHLSVKVNSSLGQFLTGRFPTPDPAPQWITDLRSPKVPPHDRCLMDGIDYEAVELRLLEYMREAAAKMMAAHELKQIGKTIKIIDSWNHTPNSINVVDTEARVTTTDDEHYTLTCLFHPARSTPHAFQLNKLETE